MLTLDDVALRLSAGHRLMHKDALGGHSPGCAGLTRVEDPFLFLDVFACNCGISEEVLVHRSGVDARLSEQSIKDCPYPENSSLWVIWRTGWICGRQIDELTELRERVRRVKDWIAGTPYMLAFKREVVLVR